ncbi:MAG: hypothetical protein COB41_00585 [Proteobacteria bacterium]|nr:MAG: hypothetical protein COB41_00585 [Pseudomonadota bacterium]
MEYKRISREFWNYALFPVTVNIDDVISQYGRSKDFYESIYTYSQEHYDKFIKGLKEVCSELNVEYSPDKILDVTKEVYSSLNTAKRAGTITDSRISELKSKFSVAATENIKTNKIVFDFDNEQDPEIARQDTLELCSRLISKGFKRDEIQICFSGNKGFSVEIETDKQFSRKEFENIVGNLAKDLETFDTSISDEQRLFRIPLTKHNKTKLYKIPLTDSQLAEFNIDQIRVMASPKNYHDNIESFYDVFESWGVCIKLPEEINNMKKITVEEKIIVDDNIVYEDRLELSRKPSWMSSTKFALQEGFFPKGDGKNEGVRNTAFMVLAATYKSNGYPKEIAWRMLKGVAELQAKRNGCEQYPEQRLWKEVICHVYSDKWRGGTYSEKETDLLKVISERFNLKIEGDNNRSLVNINQSIERFKKFASDFSKNRIMFGVESLDEKIVFTSGMLVGLLAAPGAGKTTFANKFMKNTSMKGEKVLYECLDMTENFQIARLLQNYVNLTFEQILSMLEDNKPSKELLEAFDKVSEDYENLSINYRSGTTIDDIEEDIKTHYSLYGEYPRLVVVDYLEKIRGPFTDATALSGYVASRLADLAREYNVCMFVLLQPQKSAGDARKPLLSMRKVKGASIIEQDCRAIMTLWRPGFNPETSENDKYASIAIVKNNMGQTCKLNYMWDGRTGNITDMSSEESYQFDYFIDSLKEEEDKENNRFSGFR